MGRRQVAAGAALAIAILLPAVAGAQPAYKDVAAPFGVVAGWTIKSYVRDGAPYSCNALPPAGAGRIRDLVRYVKDDALALLVSNQGDPPGTPQQGMLEIGRASEPVTYAAARAKQVKDRIWLSKGAEAMLREAGSARLDLAKGSFDIPTASISQVLGATQDCVTALRKSGGNPTPAAPPKPAPPKPAAAKPAAAKPTATKTTFEYCDAYAADMVASATKGLQLKCPAMAGASTRHLTYFDWCRQATMPQVEQARAKRRAAWDSCGTAQVR